MNCLNSVVLSPYQILDFFGGIEFFCWKIFGSKHIRFNVTIKNCDPPVLLFAIPSFKDFD